MKSIRIAMRGAPLLVALSLLTACGTTYTIPTADETTSGQATKMFAEARATPVRGNISPAAGEARFVRVANKVSPVGRRLCQQETAGVPNFRCDVKIEIDRQMPERNAYFTYDNEQPVIRMTMPILQDAANDDEVAFIMSHEFGHLIGRHIHKQKQQQVAGALILGVITAAANSNAAASGQYYDPNAVERNMELGAAVGAQAYSQTFELESDMLGTRIATASGYDAVNGARYFAKPEDTKSQSGSKLSFFGTHPPNEKRLATVLATQAQIDAKVAMTRQERKAATP